MEEYITLVLKKNRINVNKEKLAEKSMYFSSLFSHNFSDSHKNKHIINYDISFRTLQNFVEWIHDDVNDNIPTKTSMRKFINANLTELLNLLELSTLYIVDELTNDAIDIIILYWLLPERVFDIWSLAQELNLKTLEDMCLCFCLDRFEELPVSSFLELSKDLFTLIISNVNIRSSIEYLKFVRNKWLTCHPTSGNIDIVEKSRPNELLHGVIVYKHDDDDDDDDDEDRDKDKKLTPEAHLYIWDSNILSKFILSIDMPLSVNRFVGMQVVGRGFNIYAVGGETRIGSGTFNLNILYYSLLSKRWHFQTKLRMQRRHMITVFIKNELVIVGGVTAFRVKTCSVEIYNIHTGEWREGAKCPESFTSVPPHCVINNKLAYLKSCVYLYDLDLDSWQPVTLNYDIVRSVDIFVAFNTTRLFLVDESLNKNEMPLWKVSVTEDPHCEKKICLAVKKEPSREYECTMLGDVYKLRYYTYTDVHLMTISRSTDQEFELHLHSRMNEGFENSIVPKLNSFSIINPNILYKTVIYK